MRIAKARCRIHADIPERLDHPRLALFSRKRALMYAEAFGDDVADRHARAQRAERVLEHDLHVAPERPHRLETQALDISAQKHNRAIGRDQPQQRQPERGLAGAGFADDAERFALAHL